MAFAFNASDSSSLTVPASSRSRTAWLVDRGLPGAGTPQAHESSDEGDEEDLADQHLEHRERLAERPRGGQVPVAGRRERRVTEEEVVARARFGHAGEELAV